MAHSTLDSFASRSRLRDFSPEVKIIFVLLSLIVGIASQSFPVPVIIAVVMAAITLTLGGVPFNYYLRWFTPVLLFSLPVVAIMPFFFGSHGELFSITLLGHKLVAYRDGLNLALLLLSRVFSGTASLFFLAFTTPMVNIFAVLERLKIPPLLLEISMLIYRYIFVVLEEAERMLFAMEARGAGMSLKSALNAFALLGANLFIRSFSRGERLNIALESRGYNGSLKVLHEARSIPLLPLTFVIFFEIFLAYLTFVTKGFKL